MKDAVWQAMAGSESMVGETVGHFRIVKKLGYGAVGEVYLAEHKVIKTRIAIKTLRPEISTNTDHVHRLFNEAVAVSRIKHAGIAKIFDVGVLACGRAYFVMEYLEGETLTKRIRRAGRLPLVEVAEIARQIASVLAATHQAGITHRDLKPDNIFLTPDAELAPGERVKILDFGVAKLRDTTLTAATLGLVGTPDYMAPEQWQDSRDVDGRADMYSLGCVAFEMATGHVPFPVTSVGAACSKHLSSPPPAIRDEVPELSRELDALVRRLLQKSPEDRPATMREVVHAFGSLGSAARLARTSSSAAIPILHAAGHASDVSAGFAIEPQRSANRGLYALLGAIGVLLLGMMVMLVLSFEKESATTAAVLPAMTPPAPLVAAAPLVAPSAGEHCQLPPAPAAPHSAAARRFERKPPAKRLPLDTRLPLDPYSP